MKYEMKQFFEAAEKDPRVTFTHVALYMALFYACLSKQTGTTFLITRRGIMGSSKILGLATYHKCIRELHAWGYIRYAPSYHPGIGSTVTLGMIRDGVTNEQAVVPIKQFR